VPIRKNLVDQKGQKRTRKEKDLIRKKLIKSLGGVGGFRKKGGGVPTTRLKKNGEDPWKGKKKSWTGGRGKTCKKRQKNLLQQGGGKSSRDQLEEGKKKI